MNTGFTFPPSKTSQDSDESQRNEPQAKTINIEIPPTGNGVSTTYAVEGSVGSTANDSILPNTDRGVNSPSMPFVMNQRQQPLHISTGIGFSPPLNRIPIEQSYPVIDIPPPIMYQSQNNNQPLGIEIPPPHSIRIQTAPPITPVSVKQMNIIAKENTSSSSNTASENSPSANSNTGVKEEYVSNLRQKLATDWKSPSEYALHILFTKFLRQAENKLNICLEQPLTTEPPIIDIIGEGVDESFDKIIESLGHIARKKPKPVIDAMMFWRKTKSEAANLAAEELQALIKDQEMLVAKAPLKSRGSTSNLKHKASGSNGSSTIFPQRSVSSKSTMGRSVSNGTARFIELQNIIEKKKLDTLKADRKSLTSIYILCRVLIEIVKQAPEHGDDDISDKLEEIVFTQLKITDPMSISSSIIKSSNWNSFAELLGCMSEKKLVSVSDRFIVELEKIPAHLPQHLEPNVHLLILGMRYLHLTNYPLEKFEESADFMRSVAKFFLRSENVLVRLAYAEVTNQLLLPLAGSLSAEVNHPIWIEAMESLLKSAKRLQSDSKYWASGFKLTVSILCASPPALFTELWIDLLVSHGSKVKTKNLDDRIIFALGISRLVWVYLYRSPETLNNTVRTLTKLLQLYLGTKKKEYWVTSDFGLINPLSDALVSIGYAHPSFLMETAMLPLIRQSFNGESLDITSHDKLILAINTYRRLLMTTERPEFPENNSRFYEMNLNKIAIKPNDTLFSEHEEVCLHIYKLFLLLDSSIGSEVWSPENQHQKQPSTPFGSFSFGFSNDNDNTVQKNNLNTILFASVLETIPCCLSITSRIPYKSTIEILTRNAVHANQLISTSSQHALRGLAAKKNPYTFITWFAKYSFDFDEKTQSSYNTSYLSSNEYNRLLLLYIDLLECWLEEFQSSKTEETKKGMGLDGIELLPLAEEAEEVSETEKLEWKNVVTVIEEVEGNGLFFLCSQDPNVRKLAIKILQIISKFDKAMTEKTDKMHTGHSRSSSLYFADRGNRLIDFLSDVNIVSLITSQKMSLSAAEKNRLIKLTSKYSRGLVLKLAESTYGVDAALWQRVYPKLLQTIFQSSPVTMALCRSIVCIRLVQVHEVILRISADADYKPANTSSEKILTQWKLYLIAACTSLTSTSDQKLHIPTPKMQHGRKKSQQIFTVQHQKIKSAKSIFKMVLPLLNAKYAMIREAVISGLSSMNVNIYKSYIESADSFLVSWKEQSSTNQIRVEMFHILTILSKFLKEPQIVQDTWILQRLSDFLKHAKLFLELNSIQKSYDYQPLRSYFAELLLKYYSSIRETDRENDLFPFQARASCFNYLKEWCGYGEFSHISEERYRSMILRAENTRDKTSISAGIEFQKTRLELIVLEAMVVMCSEPITQVIEDESDSPIFISFDIAGLLTWIEALFCSEKEIVRKLGLRALENLLEKNNRNVQLFKDVAVQCISPHAQPYVAVLYYTTLCKAVLSLDDLILEEVELVSLGLYGLVSDKEETRTYAVDLLSIVETKLHNSSYTKVFKERLANSSKSVYKSTAIEISSIFVELLSQDLCLRVFSSLVRILDLFPFEIKRDLLILMVPWVNKFTLKTIDDLDTYMVLNNLFYVTINLNDRLPNEVEKLWISLGKGNSFQNIHVSLEYIIQTSINHRNPNFVERSRDVMLYLANIPGGIGLIDTLLDNLEPKAMIPSSKMQVMEPLDKAGKYSFVANIWERLNYSGKNIIFSKAQLSIIFLVNVLPEVNESIIAKIPTILHIAVCLLDHYVPLIQESASKIICNLIFGLAPTHEKSEETVELVRNKSQLWSYDNLVKDKKGARSPKAMDFLIRNIISIFSENQTLQNDWQRIAMRWATTCPVRHIACRSFQVFRSLLTFLDQVMLRDMLHRLSNTIADDNVDIQGFAMQILMTLNAIMAELDATDLISFPQLFWSLVACLSSVHEQEFIEVLSCVTKFISKIDLDSSDTVQCLVATFPSNWEGRFDGLQQIAMIGLRSAISFDITLKLLDKLNLLKNSRIIADPESRLLFALISNLPRFLHALTIKDFVSIHRATSALTMLAEENNEPALARLVDSLAKDKFRSQKDFLSQITSFIARKYFPKYSAQTLVFLSGLLLNKIRWVKESTMEILKHIFPLVDLTRPEFIGVGADLISPLLRLLLTDLEAQALEVLDYAPDVSGSKMDKDVLRISMGNKDVKSSNTTTTTLFGIPEDSGWSIPMPTMTAATTRHNVHAVFMSCTNSAAVEGAAQEPSNMDDIVEFHADGDYALNKMETADSIPEEKDGSLSHMWAELDNLDSFFTKNTSSAMMDPKSSSAIPHGRSDSTDTTNTTHTSALESAPQLYDNKVSVILNKSLSRTPSNMSFKKYLADSFASTLGHEGPSTDTGFQRNSVLNGALFNSREFNNQLNVSPISGLSGQGIYGNENRKSLKSAGKQGRYQKHHYLPRF
ncbi:Tao3p KNAG_0E01770 [Huiozyma naganishii CBS 8797]|uniref:Cell morphogenesis protein PAG1 n=1 Tax=Huiozyma naganishii (strain ATCC MYA-139 / BCRC 22969 / CBS 8797 / KCTC 17520 / NBRC 10181 / NCYC 3082 / Yp74L-3) TaxID=1071383 RepID=J7S6K3_HUIN7|nr:hypothetical protein KNAG_0E01770 [Kazachstania naganishii CBS 8797]CCK70439.1 hypothetical protein KNAG_0E01770 [Kazachstania naganishii CBS 8797]